MKSRLINIVRKRMGNTFLGLRRGKSLKAESGFMLLELLTVMPIVSVVMGVMTMTTIMIMDVGSRNNNHIMTLTQVQNAGYWVTRDVMTGTEIQPDPSYGVMVKIISCDEWSDTTSEIDYLLSDGQLKRQINGGAAVMVARYIVASDTYFVEDPSNENKYIFTVKASLGETEIEKEYEVSRRVPESEEQGE